MKMWDLIVSDENEIEDQTETTFRQDRKHKHDHEQNGMARSMRLLICFLSFLYSALAHVEMKKKKPTGLHKCMIDVSTLVF